MLHHVKGNFVEIFQFLAAFALFCYCVLKFFPRKIVRIKYERLNFSSMFWLLVMVNEAKRKQERPDRKWNVQRVLMWECGYVYTSAPDSLLCGASSFRTNLRLQFNPIDVMFNVLLPMHESSSHSPICTTNKTLFSCSWQLFDGAEKGNLIWLSTHSYRHDSNPRWCFYGQT